MDGINLCRAWVKEMINEFINLVFLFKYARYCRSETNEDIHVYKYNSTATLNKLSANYGY